MSQENVAMIRRVYAEFEARREPPWELFAPDAEFDTSDVMPDVGVVRGREAAEPALRAYIEAFDDFRIEFEELIAADGERVVAAVRDGGRIAGSDQEIRNRFFHVFTVREGRIVRWPGHLERTQAFKAASLWE